jgi:(p)ppGpp synthase/HD superfamily hydrolase
MSYLDTKEYFCNLHDVTCNQKYNKTLPYSFHLEMVAAQARKFEHLIPVDDPYNSAVWIAIWGHDSLEDARLNYSEIKEMWGEIAADIIYLCTEDKGKNRIQKKSHTWYNQLKTNDLAVFVKLCDIMANVKFSLLANLSMFDMYRREYSEMVAPHLYCEEYKEMFNHLKSIFTIK